MGDISACKCNNVWGKINLVLHSGNVGVQSSTNTCNVKSSVIKFGRMAISSVFLDWWKRSN